VDYFAANAYLEAEAAAQAIEGDPRARPTLSIAWEAWREVGMAAREVVPEELRAGREASLRLGLDPAEGFEVFRRALASGHKQVLISTHDLPRRLAEQSQTSKQLTTGTESSQLTQSSSATSYPRPDLETKFVQPEGTNQVHVARLWMELLGLERVGAADDFFALGGNSLLLMQVSAGLRKQLEIVISMRELFDLPTLSLVAERVDALQLLDSVAVNDDALDDEDTEEFRL
jgi:phthiocerol/phenolphthiocerol synthesis type-I polyketide synthase E